MIYFNDDIHQALESVYLDEGMSLKLGNCGIFINPVNVKYLVGKVIILNDPTYEKDLITTLLDNNCHIITRTWVSDDLVYEPYIVRINENIQWNGLEIQYNSEVDQISDNYTIRSDNDGRGIKLFFPKIKGLPDNMVHDIKGNLTGLGWLLHQVGINLDKSGKYSDLDLIKTKKILL